MICISAGSSLGHYLPHLTKPQHILSVLFADASAWLSSVSHGTLSDGETSRAVLVNLSHVCQPVLVSA